MKKIFPVFSQFPRYLLKIEAYQFRGLSKVSKDTYEDPAEFTWKWYVESEGPPPRVGSRCQPPAQAVSTLGHQFLSLGPTEDTWFVCRILGDTLRNKKQ